MPNELQPAPGVRVQTFDRRKVGDVVEVRGDRIRLTSGGHRTFWISDALVRSVDHGVATLHVDSQALRRYREPERPARPRWYGLVIGALAMLFCGRI